MKRLLAAAGVAVAFAVTGVIVFAQPFGAAGGTGEIDNGTATSTARIERRDLSSQTQVSATLGYGSATTIALPAGTAPASVEQAAQQRDTATATFHAAEAALAADRTAVDEARATLAADRSKLGVDCGASATDASCTADAQAVAADQQGVTTAEAKVAADAGQVSSARTALATAEAALAEAQASAATSGQTSVYTWLPAVGDVIRRGGALYAVGGVPALLLYGSVTPWRAFRRGMSPGRDVAELNANLHLPGDAFTTATEAAVRAFQAQHGLPVTGELLLGAVVFQAGAVRVTSVTPSRGAPVQAGPVIGVTSTRRVVTIALDASSQTSVKVGDPVVITLPDNSTTPGRVSYVGTVATTPSGDNGNDSGTPTIEVRVTPTHPAETGRLDQAPVDVSVTTDTRRGVLVAPVDALLALASGGYAVEAVAADDTHRLIPVQLGLFDDSQGLVEVQGDGIHTGLAVVVPGS
jgi:peptidoglycan hydrolase-like protein with peptidoglycan-binding domain